MQLSLLHEGQGAPDCAGEINKNLAVAIAKNRNGIAAQFLVTADLLIRGFEAGIFDGVDTDIMSIIDGEIRRFQVKSAYDGCRFGGCGGAAREGRALNSYHGKIDAFAFVHSKLRSVFYVHPKAVNAASFSIPETHWGRAQCEMSFNELLKRWRANL